MRSSIDSTSPPAAGGRAAGAVPSRSGGRCRGGRSRGRGGTRARRRRGGTRGLGRTSGGGCRRGRSLRRGGFFLRRFRGRRGQLRSRLCLGGRGGLFSG